MSDDKKYFFELGNNPALSLAEILAVFQDAENGELVGEKIFIFSTSQFIAPNIIKKMGGIIKIGEIKSASSANEIFGKIEPLLDPSGGKYNFGISYYGAGKFNARALGMEIKKYLRAKNISCRWVVSRDRTLSSVVVEQNKLVSSGLEIALIPYGNSILVGKTLAVQPFKELSYRDYGRPARDDQSGMLPPKLAQIMINLSKAKSTDTILDPFCGSGTILTEAMLMGYRSIIGSDISAKAVSDTKKNMEWIMDNYKLRGIDYQLHNIDASRLTAKIKPNSIDAIITEPYLGPSRGKINVDKIIPKLEKLYNQSLQNFKIVLKKRIVIILPVFFNKRYLNPRLDGFKIISPLENFNAKNIIQTPRNTIVYGRPGQKIWREIMILEKE